MITIPEITISLGDMIGFVYLIITACFFIYYYNRSFQSEDVIVAMSLAILWPIILVLTFVMYCIEFFNKPFNNEKSIEYINKRIDKLENKLKRKK